MRQGLLAREREKGQRERDNDRELEGGIRERRRDRKIKMDRKRG